MNKFISQNMVVDILTALENEFRQYEPFTPNEAAMYRRLCEVKIDIRNRTSMIDAPEFFSTWERVPGADGVFRCSRCKATFEENPYARYHGKWVCCPACTAKMYLVPKAVFTSEEGDTPK